jgi:hypothetical protein
VTARIVSAEEARSRFLAAESDVRGVLDYYVSVRDALATVPDDIRERLTVALAELVVGTVDAERDAALARVARLEADNAALWRDLHAASEGVAKRNARMQTQLDRVFPVESREVEARIADLVSVVLDCETANMATHRHVPRPILAMQRKVERLEREAADAATSTPTPPADSKAPR